MSTKTRGFLVLAALAILTTPVLAQSTGPAVVRYVLQPGSTYEDGCYGPCLCPNLLAPMVGTFYRAPSPDADDYVQVGSKIGPESVVCILEAMKVMNEIKAECSGEIVKICVQNAEAVEYGQALFVVKPS